MATTIWVVDDEEAVRDALEAMIKELGYQVRSFSSAEDVLAAYKQEVVSPDVVITDVRMPGMSGMDLTRALLQIDPHAIVIILTAYPSIPNAVESIRNGAADFLSKPCRIEEMRIRLEHALESRDLQARLKKTRMIAWGLIASLPIWFILGIILAKILQP
jgi:two-component system, NtrC family, C4-dicarboxylate transport response regulator DctD